MTAASGIPTINPDNPIEYLPPGTARDVVEAELNLLRAQLESTEITLEMSDAGSLVLSRIKDDVAEGEVSLRASHIAR